MHQTKPGISNSEKYGLGLLVKDWDPKDCLFSKVSLLKSLLYSLLNEQELWNLRVESFQTFVYRLAWDLGVKSALNPKCNLASPFSYFLAGNCNSATT